MSLPLYIKMAIAWLALLALWVFGTNFAHAAATEVSAGDLVDTVRPWIEAAASGVLMTLIGWGAALLRRYVGIQLDSGHRAALHSAAMTGVRMALSQLSTSGAQLTVDTRSEIIAGAVRWMRTSVPEAIAYFGLPPERLAALAESKAAEVLGQTPLWLRLPLTAPDLSETAKMVNDALRTPAPPAAGQS